MLNIIQKSCSFLSFLKTKAFRKQESEIVIANLKDQHDKLLMRFSIMQESLEKSQREIALLTNNVVSLQSQLNEEKLLVAEEKAKRLSVEEEKNSLSIEHEMSLEKTVAIMSDLISFCELLKCMSGITAEECVSTVVKKIGQALEDYGVTIRSKYKGNYDPSCHRIVEVREVDDPLLDNCVDAVLKAGYWLGDRCLVPQDVRVMALKQ